MKFYIVLLALAAFAMAEADPNLEARAGCSQKGKYCNGGTFLCCPGQGSCKGNVTYERFLQTGSPHVNNPFANITSSSAFGLSQPGIKLASIKGGV
ncbi:hypothetical protein N7453_007740 [Penicillium expansum]|nr:hypothetical protein N7453_007740 [Penicillium expansum]